MQQKEVVCIAVLAIGCLFVRTYLNFWRQRLLNESLLLLDFFKAFMCTENWMLSLCKCVDFRPGTITKTNHKVKAPKVKVKSFLPYPRIELGTSGLALQCSTNWANRVMLISLCFLDLLNVAERGWVCIAWLAIGCLFVRTSLNFGGKGYSMKQCCYWIF